MNRKLALTDVDKWFILDGNPSQRVRLRELRGGLIVQIEFESNNQLIDVHESRLTAFAEQPVKKVVQGLVQDYKKKKEAERKPEFPKLLRLEFRMLDANGKTVIRTLEGQEAEKWYGWMRELCIYADFKNINPDWQALKWKIQETELE